MKLNNRLKYCNLLYIDDQSSVRSDIYALLAPSFKSIHLAEDVTAARRLYQEQEIDIIITDIEMPGESGLDFVEEVRHKNHTLPIIVLTAFTDTSYLLHAANLQIDGYITKPLTFDKLGSALESAVKKLSHKYSIIKLANAISYNPATKQLDIDNTTVSLGKKERLLLELFIDNDSQIVSKEMIEKTIWPSINISESALKNLLNELRTKLKYNNIIINQPAQGWFINTQESS